MAELHCLIQGGDPGRPLFLNRYGEAAWLGHISLDTTKIYAETDLAIKAKALAACHPWAGRRRSKKKWPDNPNVMDFVRKL